jgi:predicted NUDIX family NTP pyrophosphohydrolase
MAQHSAGLLIYRLSRGAIEVLLVHPGGPIWHKKDRGAWQIPKGLIEPGEAPRQAALREAQEELGLPLTGALLPMGEIRQAGGKHVAAFALQMDLDPAAVVSNSFEMEWPPRSGRLQRFPEIDRAHWFALARAQEMMLESQRPFLDRLERLVLKP